MDLYPIRLDPPGSPTYQDDWLDWGLDGRDRRRVVELALRWLLPPPHLRWNPLAGLLPEGSLQQISGNCGNPLLPGGIRMYLDGCSTRPHWRHRQGDWFYFDIINPSTNNTWQATNWNETDYFLKDNKTLPIPKDDTRMILPMVLQYLTPRWDSPGLNWLTNSDCAALPLSLVWARYQQPSCPRQTPQFSPPPPCLPGTSTNLSSDKTWVRHYLFSPSSAQLTERNSIRSENWSKYLMDCKIFPDQASESEIMWVMRIAIFVVGGMATFMALTIPTIYGLWWVPAVLSGGHSLPAGLSAPTWSTWSCSPSCCAWFTSPTGATPTAPSSPTAWDSASESPVGRAWWVSRLSFTSRASRNQHRRRSGVRNSLRFHQDFSLDWWGSAGEQKAIWNSAVSLPYHCHAAVSHHNPSHLPADGLALQVQQVEEAPGHFPLHRQHPWRWGSGEIKLWLLGTDTFTVTSHLKSNISNSLKQFYPLENSLVWILSFQNFQKCIEDCVF